MRTLIAAILLVGSAEAGAAPPTKIYCGGAVQELSGSWFARDQSSFSGLDGAERLAARPPDCSGFNGTPSPTKGGLGDEYLGPSLTSPSQPIHSLYFSDTLGLPNATFGRAAALLGRKIQGPGFSPASKSMEQELKRLRYMLDKNVTRMNDGYSSVAADLSRLEAQVLTENRVSRSALEQGDTETRERLIRHREALGNMPAADLEQFDGLRERLVPIAGEITLPVEHLRPNGRSVLGLLDKQRAEAYSDSPVQGEVALELAKLNGLAKEDFRDTKLMSAREALLAAKKFAESRNPTADAVAIALVREARSRRFNAQRLTSSIEIAVQSDDGITTTVTISAHASRPANSILDATRRFESVDGVAKALALRGSELAPGDDHATQKRIVARDIGNGLIAASRSVFYGGDIQSGVVLQAYGIALLDAAVSVTPLVGWGKDVYESLTGINPISGVELSADERAFALLGALSFGVGSKLKLAKAAVPRVIERVAPLVSRLDGFRSIKTQVAAFYAYASVKGFDIARGASISKVRGFASPERLKAHLRHARELKLTPHQYVEAAKAFGRSTDPTSLALRRPSSGDVVKWNRVTNEFGVYAKSGHVITYYRRTSNPLRPDRELNDFAYFVEQYAKDAARGAPRGRP